MASFELTQYVEKLIDKIENEGITIERINALFNASTMAMFKEEDVEYSFKCTEACKRYISKYVLQETHRDFWTIENLCVDNKQKMDVIELYYAILKQESFHNFQSFIYYMERNRASKKRFYFPRRKTLHVVVQDLMDLEDRKFKFYGLSMPSRVGKALAWNTPVLTNHGWKNHGELTIMDKVIGLDGEFKDILAIHNPCDMEYRVNFSDGTAIECHGNHEWVVNVRGSKGYKTLATKDIFGNTDCLDGHKRYGLPIIKSVSGSHKDLWVDPYTLGAWLGDGRNQNPDICGDENDYAIIQKILDAGYELAWDTKHSTTGVRYYGFKGLREQLQKYDMCHSRRRCEKHIPDEYLLADEEQRLELLAGLLDTDGYLSKKEHRYQFTTADVFLKEDVISLIHTFGWRTSVIRHEATTSSSGIKGRRGYWVIGFNPTRYIPCQLERKQLNEFSEQRAITIESIEEIKSKVRGNCITVEGGVYLAGRTLKPTHNSTICIFFLSWIMLKRPNSHSAMGGHSGVLAKGFYKEVMNLITSEDYTFSELYQYWHPEHTLLRDKSAEEFTITLDEPDRFATLTCRGIDGTWTGAVDISKDGYLYIDDLVRDRQHSLSPQRMDDTFNEYLNKCVDRKIDGARELMVGTLWNVTDPLERIRVQQEGNPEYKFRRIPALNEKGESNFDYDFNGFSTKYFLEVKERLERPEWEAKYMARPFVREGLLYPVDELRMFDGDIPSELSDANYKVVAVIDPAFGGGDSLSMPICADFGDKSKFIIDWVFSKATQKQTVKMVTNAIIKHGISEVVIEKNNGGLLYADSVKEALEKAGCWHCKVNVRTAPNKMSKEDKISAYSDAVKDNFIFLLPRKAQDKNRPLKYYRSQDYQNAMDELCIYSAEGKNPHDDAPDSIVQLAMFFERKNSNKIEVIKNPFRT